MKHAKKFMVVPYEENKFVSKTSDTKITDILNNPKIDQENKVKLINQILISNKNKSENVIPTNNDVNETFNKSIQNPFNFNENFNQTNENFDKTINNETKILKTPANKLKSRTLNQVNKKLDKLNASINNGYLNLAPAFSTRLNTNKFIDKKLNISLSNQPRIKRLKRKPNINMEFLKNKVTDTVNQLSKSDRKRKLEINPNQLNETFNEDMDTTDPKVLIGHGWSIYKK